MNAEIVCVGSELLLGDIVDTNTQYLAQRLSALGIDLYFSTSVGDNLGRVVDCLRRAHNRSDVVLTSGGLGPTDDDLTREAIAELMGETPVVDPSLADELRRFFALRRIEMTTNNLKQASLIPSARAIRNPRGTAPGWWVSKNGKSIIAMPGPPGELHYMWENEIEPKLGDRSSVIKSRTLKVFNISESLVDNLLKPLTPSSNPTVAVYAKQDGIHVRITAKASNGDAALKAIRPVEEKARVALGEAVWGADEDTMDSVVAALLVRHNATVAVAETITGGQLAFSLSANEIGLAQFRGAVVMPAIEGKGGDATAMARTAIERFGSDIGVAVSGFLIPDSEPRLDELTIAIVWPKRDVSIAIEQRTRHLRGRAMGVYYALDALRKVLLQV